MIADQSTHLRHSLFELCYSSIHKSTPCKRDSAVLVHWALMTEVSGSISNTCISKTFSGSEPAQLPSLAEIMPTVKALLRRQRLLSDLSCKIGQLRVIVENDQLQPRRKSTLLHLISLLVECHGRDQTLDADARLNSKYSEIPLLKV